MQFSDIKSMLNNKTRPMRIAFAPCIWSQYFSPCVLVKEVKVISTLPNKGFHYMYSNDFL
eukprot:UN00362